MQEVTQSQNPPRFDAGAFVLVVPAGFSGTSLHDSLSSCSRVMMSGWFFGDQVPCLASTTAQVQAVVREPFGKDCFPYFGSFRADADDGFELTGVGL